MKLSIVIICWNDLRVIKDCLASIYSRQLGLTFEVIVSDNGSSDGSVEYIHSNFPQVRILENKANLGFARANNVGIRAAAGEFTLILNPDTLVHDDALDKWIAFADRHPEAGAFGCRVLNADGSFHEPAQVFPTIWRCWVDALCLSWLGRFIPLFRSGEYKGWNGLSERPIDWQSGCCVLFRSALLRQLDGFDERFFYNFEETDLCKRVWDSGHSILYTPAPRVTHLWGQSTNRFPIRFAIEKIRNRYRYFHKHFGVDSLAACRRAVLTGLYLRRLVFGCKRLFARSEALDNRLAMYRTVIEWNRRLNPIHFIETGEEPDVGYAPLMPPPVVQNRL